MTGWRVADPADGMRGGAGWVAPATAAGMGGGGEVGAGDIGLAGAGAGATEVVDGRSVDAGTADDDVAAASVIVVVSGTVSSRPGRRCALVRRWFSSASDSIGTP